MTRRNGYLLGSALFIVGTVLMFSSENPPGRARYTAAGAFGMLLVSTGATLLVAMWLKADDGPY